MARLLAKFGPVGRPLDPRVGEPEHQVSASSLDKLKRRLKKKKIREISADALLGLIVSMISLIDVYDRLAVMG